MRKVTNKLLAYTFVLGASTILFIPALIGLIIGGTVAAHNITRKSLEGKIGTNLNLKVDRVKPD